MGNYIDTKCPIDGSNLISETDYGGRLTSCLECRAVYKRYFIPEDLKEEASQHLAKLQLDITRKQSKLRFEEQKLESLIEKARENGLL